MENSSASCGPKSDTQWFRSHPVRWLDVGTAEIAYRAIGVGPPLLFLHGWPFSSLSFRRIVPELSRRFTCILPDTPGLGDTRWTADTPFEFARQLETMRSFVGKLDLPRCAVIAHDTGGTFARLLALAEPSRVERLVLLNTEIPGHRPPWVQLFQRLAALPGTAAAFSLLLRSSTFRRSSMGYGGCFYDPARLDDDFYDCFVAPLLASRQRLDGVLRYVQGIDWGLIDAFAHRHAELKMPVRLIWGARDAVFPLANARPMLSQFGGPADLIEVADARFLVHEEQSQVVAAAALAFLQPAGAA